MKKLIIDDLPTFDAADYLADTEARQAYVAAATEDGDAIEIQDAVELVARAEGVQKRIRGDRKIP